MSENVYSLVYCSRNEIAGSPADAIVEIQQILAASRRNNSKAGVTGALLFNEGVFAQVLEGPLGAVEQIFERIQYDGRHNDVTVLQSGFTERRSFPDWSMAFASTALNSTSGESELRNAAPTFAKAFANPSAAGEEVLKLLHELVVQEDPILAA